MTTKEPILASLLDEAMQQLEAMTKERDEMRDKYLKGVELVNKFAQATVDATKERDIARRKLTVLSNAHMVEDMYQAGLDQEREITRLTKERDEYQQAAYDIGAKGSEPTEEERLAFESWMRGHCWKVEEAWDGKQYVHAHESTGFVHGGAMNTRRLWAAWRDRGAVARLLAEQAQAVEPVGEIVLFGEGLKEVSWAKGKMPSVGSKLYAHPAPPPAMRLSEILAAKGITLQKTFVEKPRDHIEHAGKMPGERAGLIADLRILEGEQMHSTHAAWVCAAADMLEADGVLADKRVAAIAADREYWRERAQQVAVPIPESQINELSDKHLLAGAHDCVLGVVEFARAIEAHHRIGAKLVTKPDSLPDWSAA